MNTAKNNKMTAVELVTIGDVESRDSRVQDPKTGIWKDTGDTYQVQQLTVRIQGTIRVNAYGASIERLAQEHAESGDLMSFMFKKTPSITIL